MALKCQMFTGRFLRLYLHCYCILLLRIFHSAVAQIPRPVLTLHEGHIGLYDRLMETQFNGNLQPGRPYTLDIYMANSDQFDYIINQCVYRRRITFFDQNGCFRKSNIFLEQYERNEIFPFGPMKRTIVHFYSEPQFDVRCQVRVVQCNRCAEYACSRRPLLNSYPSWTILLAFNYEIGGCDGGCGTNGGRLFPPQHLPPLPCGTGCGSAIGVPPCAAGCGSIAIDPCLNNCGDGAAAVVVPPPPSAIIVDGCESCVEMPAATCSQCPFLAFGCVYQCYNCNPCFAVVPDPWYSRIPMWLWILFGVALLLFILLLLCTICACIYGARRNRQKVHPSPRPLTAAIAATHSYPHASAIMEAEKPRIFTDRLTQTEKIDADAKKVDEEADAFRHVSRVSANADSGRDQQKSYQCQQLQFDDFSSIPLRTTRPGSGGGGRYSKHRLDGSGREDRTNYRSYSNENENVNSYGNINSLDIRNERWEEYNETEEISECIIDRKTSAQYENYPLPIAYRSEATSRHGTIPSRRPFATEATVTRFSSSDNPGQYHLSPSVARKRPDYSRTQSATRDIPYRSEYYPGGGNGNGSSSISYPTTTEETFREELTRTVRQQSAL